MPTDWSITELDTVQKLKSKFNGNPRYVEVMDKFNKKSKGTTDHSTSSLLKDEYMDEGEEHREAVQRLESSIFNDLVSNHEAEDIMEMVRFK